VRFLGSLATRRALAGDALLPGSDPQSFEAVTIVGPDPRRFSLAARGLLALAVAVAQGAFVLLSLGCGLLGALAICRLLWFESLR
jgi:hypothetical protein